MRWSVSMAQVFKQCPRKWYFSNLVVNGKVLDPLQKETKFLKSVRTIYAWRGQVVDSVISDYLIPKINRKEILHEQNVVDYAKEFAWKQIRLAQRSEADFALFELEYEEKIDGKLLESLVAEIELSLRNFIKSNFLIEFYKHGKRLVPQRLIQCKVNGVNVICKPDVIAFYHNKPPIIVDWKVQQISSQDHRRQLAVYAFAVSRATPHKDLLNEWQSLMDPTKIELLECQLLHGRERLYELNQSDVSEIEDFIYMTSNKMLRLFGDDKYPKIQPDEIPTTLNPGTCSRCQFKRVCWEKQND